MEVIKQKGEEMKDLFLRYIREEDGQTSTEYILLVAVVAMIVMKFKEKATTGLNSITDGVFKNANGFVDQLNNQ